MKCRWDCIIPSAEQSDAHSEKRPILFSGNASQSLGERQDDAARYAVWMITNAAEDAL